MPRPEDLTDEQIAEYDAGMNPSWEPLFALLPKMREATRAGCWIGQQLRTAGAAEDEVEQTCTAFGQMAVSSPDLWETAKQVVARFQTDRTHETPGLKLAVKLIEEAQQ